MAEEKYVNQAYLSVTESAPNTLTFGKLETGVSIFEKVGWIISRLDYFVSIPVSDFAAEGDSIEYGLSVMDSLVAVGLNLAAVVDTNARTRRDFGVAASGMVEVNPQTKSFAELPGGGLLLPPNPIYIFAKGIGLTAAQVVSVRMFYVVRTLKTEDFWELVEQRRMIGA